MLYALLPQLRGLFIEHLFHALSLGFEVLGAAALQLLRFRSQFALELRNLFEAILQLFLLDSFSVHGS